VAGERYEGGDVSRVENVSIVGEKELDEKSEGP